ncbi:MAG: glycosyltransferase family 39 protein [Phycisphaerae bacterium]|nr:glycosyltransferase family 39 protein [Phycisphaerae bacterium]
MSENCSRKIPARQWWYLGFALILIFVISFAVRVFRLDFYSLWYDEVSTASLLQPGGESSALSTIIHATGSETLHPLYYLVLAGWLKFAGNSVWALRLPSVFFGSCAVVVYSLLLYQAGLRKALAFSLLLIISPYMVWYSRDARPYSLIMFLTGLHILFYLNFLVKPQSRICLYGVVITGILSIYSGVFVAMLLMAEFAWGILRRKPREVAVVAIVLLCALPLFWQGYRTFFLQTSDRYRSVPGGVSAVRVMGIPQELLVARSFGPTPDEVRRFPLSRVISEKSLEMSVEAFAIVCILGSLVAGIISCKKTRALNEHSVVMIQALGFVAVAVCLQAAVLIAIIGFGLCARHIAFLFGPLFVLAFCPIACSDGYLRKALFIVPLVILWTWSSANQLFDSSYVTDDFKNAAKIISNDEHNASQVVVLCHPKALSYYGVEKPLIYFMESPEVTVEILKDRLKDEGNPVWLVLNRPWSYPEFRAKDLANYFQVLRTEELPGIGMWLLSTINYSK